MDNTRKIMVTQKDLTVRKNKRIKPVVDTSNQSTPANMISLLKQKLRNHKTSTLKTPTYGCLTNGNMKTYKQLNKSDIICNNGPMPFNTSYPVHYPSYMEQPPVSTMTQPFVSTINQPPVSPMTQPFVSPMTQPFVSPMTQPFVSRINQQPVSPKTQPFVSPMTQPFVSPINQQPVSPMTQPFVSPVTQPFVSPVVQSPVVLNTIEDLPYIKKTFTLGKNKTKKTISVLISRRVHKNTNKNTFTLKNKLKLNNLIKYGSSAPNNLLQDIYNANDGCGDIININYKNTLKQNELL